ncbi:L-asparaginase, N-terminal [Phytophthora cactorum]|nr:L-asparaginase, N-terminal [Phytophthora cactorum]
MPKNKSKTRDPSNSFSASFDGAQDGVSPVAVPLTESEAHVQWCRCQTRTSHCLVIYTGGTFGMVPDENGVLHPSSGFLEKKINEMDEFKFENMPHVTVSEWANPIDSSDMTPDDWGTIAQEIEAKYWDYDGFVVLQGTDTMAYTASALSFMLEYLGKPVVISGAMIPLHFPHSDARRNLIMSVCIYSNNKLLRGNRTTKVANMSVDAFHSPNFPSLAVTGVEAIVDQPLILPYPRSRFRVFTNLSTNICVFHLALVFALFGTGNAPLRKDGFLRLVKMAVDADIPVTITSQCVQGRTQLDTYATGVNLLNMGVITSLDMTIEACVAKLAYLMGKGFTGKQLKTKMETTCAANCPLWTQLRTVKR